MRLAGRDGSAEPALPGRGEKRKIRLWRLPACRLPILGRLGRPGHPAFVFPSCISLPMWMLIASSGAGLPSMAR